MSNTTKGPFMQAMEKYTKSIKTFISAQGFGHYSKPSGGIPKTDLEQSVQNSLGLADTALQGFTETDPTVPAWAKASTKPSYTQDEVGDGTTYKRVSATEKTAWNNKGTYSKPSGGIPKTDLASAVQTSLGKADSALQSETDPTVPSWAKAASKPSYTASEVGLGNVGNFKAVSTVASQGLSDTEKSNARANIGAGTGNGTYSKPSGGIPKTDLASAVQTSLGKADSALQSHQTIKQDGITGATVNRFGTCSTAAATAAKTVSVTSGTFSLEAGARVTVKFTNANTADTPTLNVNSKGAKNIFSKGAQITTGSNKSLLAGTVDFIYDGTQWHLIGNYIDTNTTYSSKSAASGGTDVSLCTTGEKYSWNNKGTYSKPSGGIPKTDLASAVQTSLGKADSALQSETDPTVPAWAKAASKPSYTASEVGLGNVGNFKAVSTVASQGLSDTEKSNARANIGAGTGNGTYSKPSDGIPKTDLASAVQTSLGKADSALQSETDPTVPAWAKAASKPSYTASEVGLGNVGNFKAVSTVASQGLSDTEKSNARANIGAGTGNGTYSKPSDGIPKTDLASAVQTSLGKADSALQSHQTIKQDGVTGATVNRFGTCGTAAATAAKTVSITTGTFTLEAGARVTVKFSNANTAGTPTLNVNSTGAKNIYSKGSQIKTGSNKSLLAGTVDFIYDGTQYHLIGNYIDTNTTYSSKSAASGGTDVSLCTTGEKYTWNSKGTYSKPSGGIPKTDLASAVQTSLGKADSALQSFTESDPTVPSWAKQSSKPSYTASEVGALALTGNTITGDIQRKQTEIDASKANNNISATKYPTTYSIIDNSGRIMVRNEAIVEPSGNISWYAYVRNYNTSGGQVAQKGIKYTVNKSGAGTWTVDDATSFKSAIGLADLSKLFSPTYVQPTKHSNITSIDDGGYIQIGKLTILNMRFTVGTECGQWTDIFTDCPLPLSSLSGGYGVVACSSNTNQAFAICANGRLQNYSGTLNPGSYVVSACYMTQ